MIKQKLKQLLIDFFKSNDINLSNSDVAIETPKNKDHGDFATTVAFSLAKLLRKAPKQIAEDFVDLLNKSELNSKINAENVNGFINLSLSKEYLNSLFSHFNESKVIYPKLNSGKKMLLEYVSANPTGPLHIGHGRWAVLGSVLYNLLRQINHPVDSEFYINDAGNQIKLFYDSVKAAKEGSPIPENGYHGHYIKDLAKESLDPLIANINHQKTTLEKIDVKFDSWFSEKSLYKNNKIDDVFSILEEKKLSYKKDDALWFKSSDLGDDKDRVLIKNDGTYTYFAVDMAYHLSKVQRGYSSIVNIWGADHHGYVSRVKAALIALCGDDYKEDASYKVLIGQLVSLMRGNEPVKMSKRSGEMITLEEVIEDIGADATRYFLIDKSPDTHIEFDLDLAKKKSSENPVYYIQYAHARICNLIKKSEMNVNNIKFNTNISLEKEEKELMIKCLLVNDELWESALHFSPHKICNYLVALAKQCHHFYETCPILKSEDSIKENRLFILNKTKDVFKLCLDILGISAPEQM